MEKLIKTKKIYKGSLLNIRCDEVRTESGHVAMREIVEHPGAVAVVALTKNNKIVLIHQYRRAVKEEIIEIPAGLVHKGESPRKAALRELEEEAGYKAGKMEAVMEGYVSPGYSTEMIRYFLATDLVETGQKLEDDEDIEVELFAIPSAWKLCKERKIKDNKTVIGIILAEKYAKR